MTQTTHNTETQTHITGTPVRPSPIRMFVRGDTLRSVEFNGGGGAGYWKVPADVKIETVQDLLHEAVDIARVAGYLMIGEWRVNRSGEHVALLIPAPSANDLLAACARVADDRHLVVTSAELGPDPRGKVFLRVEFSLPLGYGETLPAVADAAAAALTG